MSGHCLNKEMTKTSAPGDEVCSSKGRLTLFKFLKFTFQCMALFRVKISHLTNFKVWRKGALSSKAIIISAKTVLQWQNVFMFKNKQEQLEHLSLLMSRWHGSHYAR